MEKCQKKALILYKGYPSLWDGVDWLSLSFESVIDLAGFSAKFRLGNFTFENSNLFEDWIINLTAEETGTLPLGMNTASLIVYDALGEGKPFTTSIPILVKDWVQGDVKIDTYKAVVKATLDNQTQIAIRIETAKVSLDWVEGKIAEHNNSTEAHSYIQGLISSEKEARENADSSLSQRITENTNRFSNYRTRVQQDVIDNNLQEQINAVSGDLSNYRTAADQDIIDNAQNTAINGKQAKLNTAQMNAVNSGITSAKVSSYDSHIANTTIHVTAQDKQTWNAKQNALNSTQMDAVNSGITSTGVTQITTNKNNIADEITNRENADIGLQSQIDAIVASSDVTDIVGTYAQLQAYDTSSLPPNSIIKVLKDESQNDETTYYRWVINGGVGSWVLIGEEGPYYTKSQADERFATAAQGAKADTALQPSALNGYATEVWVGQQGFLTSTALVGYATQQWVTNQGYLTSISSSDVVNALGYTPYNSSNPAGYITSSGIFYWGE